MPKESTWNLGPLGYLGLFVSTLLNISGLSSIVQGFVELGGFLGDLVNQYRTWIREPIRAVFGFIWIPLPWWLADWCVVGGSFLAIGLLISYQKEEKGRISATISFIAKQAFTHVVVPMFCLFIKHLVARLITIGAWALLAPLGLFLLLLFLNWQVQKLGYW